MVDKRQETVWETGDRTGETGQWYRRQKKGDRRSKTGEGKQKIEDMRRETEDGRQETVEPLPPMTKPFFFISLSKIVMETYLRCLSPYLGL